MNYEKPGTITLLQNMKMNAVNLNYSFEVGHLETIVDVGLTAWHQLRRLRRQLHAIVRPFSLK